MGWLAKILRPRASDPGFDDGWYATAPGGLAATGAVVNATTAMKLSAVWACVRLITQSMATASLLVYRRLANGGRERAEQHPLYDVLHLRPNYRQTAFQWIEMLTGHLLLRGNAYAQIVPGPRGFVDQLVPLHPDRVEPEEIAGGGVRYRVRQADGSAKYLNDEDVFHLCGLSDDGLRGLSILEYARESFGLGLAAEGYGARFFSQDARPGGVLKHPQKLRPDTARRIRDDWEALHGGYRRSHSVAVLEEGMEWQQIGMSSEDAQFLETREFQVADIARWFGCPLHLIQETSKATSWGSGIESLGIAYVTYTLLPLARRWEQALTRDLVLAADTYYPEFLLESLVRGDLLSQYNAFDLGRRGGWLSVNDIRQRINMNPVPGGDTYLQPMNMTPVGGETATEEDAEGSRGSGGAKTALAAGHYHLLLHEAAMCVIRKEIASMGKVAKRCEADAGAWRAAVEEFYGEHVDFVRERMRIGGKAAALYCHEQASDLEAHGAICMSDWETRRVRDLIALALGETARHDGAATGGVG